jgi:hypothetical protein
LIWFQETVFLMRNRFVTFSLTLLSLLLAGSAFAGPRMREARQQRASVSEERNIRERLQQNEANRQAQAAPAQSSAPPAPEHRGGFGEVGQSGNLNPNQFQQVQPPRPGARMSVEDRRRLRRQINEAGQDIYEGQKK